MVRGADAPQDQRRGYDNERDRKEPKAVLGLADTVVTPCEPQRDLVAAPARPEGAGGGAEERREVADADNGRREVVGRRTENERCGTVEHVEPHEIAAVREAGIDDDGKGEEN